MENETTPLDDIISQLDSFIENPKLVTSESLAEIRDSIMSLKEYLDSENGDMEDSEKEDMPEGKHPTLSIIIGMGKKRKRNENPE